MGKTLVWAGLGLALVGAMLWLAPSVPFLRQFGRLPGDVVIESGSTRVYFPWVTMLLVSVIGSLVLWLLGMARR